MKRFVRLLVVTVGFGVLGFVMSLVPQKNATGAGGAPVNIISPVPLPVTGTVAAQQSGDWNVGISNAPTVSLASGATVNVGNAASSPVPVQSVEQSAANFVTLDFEGGGYLQVFGDGTEGSTTFTLSGKQLVITDVQWEISCLSSCSVGDAVTLELADHAFRSEATYANRGGLPVAGRSDRLASGFVADTLPTPTVLSGSASAGIDFLVLRGYLVP